MTKRKSGDVTIRLGLAERRRLDAVAARHHLPISTWLRQVAMKAAELDLIFDEGARRKRVAAALAALDEDPAPPGDLDRRRAGWTRKT